MCPEASAEERLDGLIEAWLARRREGESLSIAAFAAEHPEDAEDIRDVFPLLEVLEPDAGMSSGLTPGTIVGPYEILREVGRGGMGVVYEARQQDLDRSVALKLLPVQATLDARFLERFRLEAHAAARLAHPHIVPVIGYGEDGGHHWYSMHFVEGESLDVAIARRHANGSPDPRPLADDAVRIGRALAEAMAHAHAQGVLHRDLKPTNVLLDREGRPRITDFGLCRATDTEGLTRTGDVVGTFRYMPPERFRGVSDVRGDVYGIGVILYQVLTGRPPYEGSDAAMLAATIPQQAPPRLRARAPGIPRDLAVVVGTAMAHDPARRYPTAQALAADLLAVQEGRPVAARAPTAGYLLRRWVARHKAVAATVFLALAALVGLTVWYVRGVQEKEAEARDGQMVASLAGAAAALEGGDGAHARALLAAVPPERRRWAWRYLDARTRPALARIPVGAGVVQGVAWSPDGMHLAIGVDREVRLHADATLERVATLACDGVVGRVQWVPDGSALVVGTTRGVELWAWPSAERRWIHEGQETTLLALAAAGRQVVAGFKVGALVRLDTTNGERLDHRALGHRLSSGVADDPVEATRVLLGSTAGELRVMSLADGTDDWRRPISHHAVTPVAWPSPDRVAVATVEGIVHLLDASDGSVIGQVGAGGDATANLITDDVRGRLLHVCPPQVRELDPRTGRVHRTWTGALYPRVVAAHPGGQRIWVGAVVGGVESWYAGGRQAPGLLDRHMDDVIAVAIDPTGRWVASGGFGGVLRLWDLDANELARVGFAHGSNLASLAFDPSGRRIASADGQGTVVLWDAASATPHHVHRRYVPSEPRLVFHPDGDLILAWGASSLRRVDPTDLSVRASHGEEDDAVERLAPRLARTPGGDVVARSLPGGDVAIHDGRTLARRRVLPAGHDQDVAALAFHPFRPWLASVTWGQGLQIRHVGTGEAVAAWSAPHADRGWATGINAVAFTPDGQRLLTGSLDGIVRVWTVDPLRPLVALPRETWINALAVDPTGRRVVAGLAHGRVRVWASRPVAERVARLDAADDARKAARPYVTSLLAAHPGIDAPLAALDAWAAERALSEEIVEGMRRRLHVRAGSRDQIVRRVFRGLVPDDGPADARRVATGLAAGLWRAIRHGNETDPRCESLYVLALLRAGRLDLVRWVLDGILHTSAMRGDDLHAMNQWLQAAAQHAEGDVEAAAASLREARQRIEDLGPAVRPAIRDLVAQDPLR